MPDDAGAAADAAKQATDAASAAAPTRDAKKKSRTLPLLLAVVVLAAGGGGAAWYLGMLPVGGGSAGHATAADSYGDAHGSAHGDAHGSGHGDAHGGGHGGAGGAQAVGAILPFDPFIANLADEGGKRYLKTTFQVEFLGGAVPAGANARLPIIRDLVLTLLTSKTFEEVRTPEGKQRLRDEIIARVNQTFDRDVAKAVYFTDFIVQ